MNTNGKEKGTKSECVYNSNGKLPLLCAASAFVGLAIVLYTIYRNSEKEKEKEGWEEINEKK